MARKFKCKNCGQLFSSIKARDAHLKHCDNAACDGDLAKKKSDEVICIYTFIF